jgi:hypothetical protein
MDPLVTTTNNATPLISGLVVSPNDSTALVPPTGPARPTRGILVGGAGNLTVIFADGSTVLLTIPATACGVILPLAVNFVKSTGTTATLIVAFF